MYNGLINGEITMKHSVTVSHLSHTVEMTPAEALQIMAKLSEMVRLAIGPGVASNFQHDMEVTTPTGQKLLGGLTLIIRPE